MRPKGAKEILLEQEYNDPNPDEPEQKYDHCFTSWIKK